MAEIVEEGSLCSRTAAERELRTLYGLVFISTMIATALLAPGINRIALSALGFGLFDALWLPAILEEFTVRLIPAAAAYGTFLTTTRHQCLRIRPHALRLGFVIGLTMGVLEVISKVLFFGTFSVGMLPVAVLHVFNGIVLSGAFFVAVSDQDLSDTDIVGILAMLLIAIATHLTWNVWFVSQDWFWDWWMGLTLVGGALIVSVTIGGIWVALSGLWRVFGWGQ